MKNNSWLYILVLADSLDSLNRFWIVCKLHIQSSRIALVIDVYFILQWKMIVDSLQKQNHCFWQFMWISCYQSNRSSNLSIRQIPLAIWILYIRELQQRIALSSSFSNVCDALNRSRNRYYGSFHCLVFLPRSLYCWLFVYYKACGTLLFVPSIHSQRKQACSASMSWTSSSISLVLW